VKKARGPASDYRCIDCGGQAEDWSTADRSSNDVRVRFQPRCRKCHRRYDGAIGEVVANVALILDFASGTASLADLEPPPAAVAFTRELARRNVPVAVLDRAYRLSQHALWRWSVAEVRRRVDDEAAVATAVEVLAEAAFTTGDALTSVVMAPIGPVIQPFGSVLWSPRSWRSCRNS